MSIVRRQTNTLAKQFCAFAAISLVTTTASADDLHPPGYRGGPLSTSAEWDFLTDQEPENIQPDGTSVPLVVGDVADEMDIAFPSGSPHPSGSSFGDVSYVGDMSNGGYMAGTGSPNSGIAFNVPNWFDLEPVKFLRLQVTYKGPEPGTRIFGFVDGVPGTSDGVVVEFVGRFPDDNPNLPPEMSYYYEDWLIFPNPDWEQVVVDMPAGTFIDQVVIDTISIPEPSTAILGALALCGMVCIARRR